MKKSLSILLSIAMAFSIFASVAMGAEANLDVNAKYNALVEAGIFTGDGDDQAANLDQTMTRAQFAAVLVRTFGLSEDVAASKVYTDLDGAGWASGYIGAVTKAGLMNGRSADGFAPSEPVKIEELATVLARAFDLEESTSGVTGTVDDWARGYVGAALKAGLISAKADYTADALRADLVESAYVVYQIILGMQTPEATYSVTSVKEMKVAFNKAVDADKVTFNVAFGTAKTTVASTKWSDDKKVATLSFNTNLQAGEYTITVTGAAATDLVGKVTVTDEQVTSIEILGDVAPVERDDNYRIKNATVHYRVVNQYGQDVTRTSNVQWFSSLGNRDNIVDNSAEGTLTIAVDTNNYFNQVGTEFTVSGNIVGTAVSVSKTLKLGEEAKPTNLEVIGLYNDDEDKTLNLNSNYEDFYLMFNVTDQYNNPIKFSKLDDQLTIFSSRQDLLPMSTVKFVNDAGENRNQLALQLQNFEDPSKINKNFGGTAVLTFAQKFGGQLATYSIEVKKAAIVSHFSMTLPEGTVSVGDKDVEIKFTATDEDGNVVKDVDILTGKDGYYGVNVAGAEFNKDGKLMFTVPQRTGPVTIYANVLSSNQQSSITINVQEKKYPAAVTGTKAYDTILAKVESTFYGKDFTIVDQYGGAIASNNDNFFKNYALNVKVYDSTVSEATYLFEQLLTAADGANGTLNSITKDKKGNLVLVVTAVNSNGSDIDVQYGYTKKNFTVGSVKDFTVRYVDWKDITSFEIGDIAKLYSNAKDNKYSINSPTVNVYGKLSNGSKVNIGNNYALSTVTTGIEIDATGKKVQANGVEANYVDGNETKGMVTAIILKEDSPTVNKDVVISRATPVVSKIELKDQLKDGKIKVSDLNQALNTGLLKGLNATDQYGIAQAEFKKTSSVIVSEVNAKAGSTLKNGTRLTGADSINGALVGDKFTVTIVTGTQVSKVKMEVIAD